MNDGCDCGQRGAPYYHSRQCKVWLDFDATRAEVVARQIIERYELKLMMGML